MPIFKSRRDIEAAPMPNLPDPDARKPWLVQAPLHAVEVYEAIIRQQDVRHEPLMVWTSSTAGALEPLPRENCRTGHHDRFNFRTYHGRDVSYVLLSDKESATIQTWFRSWGLRIDHAPDLLTPFGPLRVVTLLDDEGGVSWAYERVLEALGLDLEAQCFARSKVPGGVEPIPAQSMFMAAWNDRRPRARDDDEDGEQRNFVPWVWALEPRRT